MLGQHFSDDDLRNLKREIRQVEEKTAGELRVVILTDCEGSASERAMEEFHRHGLAKTRDKTGVLLMLVLKQRRIELLADEGIHRLVPDGTWLRIVSTMSNHFHDGSFSAGLTWAIREVGGLLAAYVPKRPDDVNELPDDVIVEEDGR